MEQSSTHPDVVLDIRQPGLWKLCAEECMGSSSICGALGSYGTNRAGLRGRPPKFDGRPRTASGSILSAGGGGGGGDMTAGTTRSLGDQTAAALSTGAYDSGAIFGFVPYEVGSVGCDLFTEVICLSCQSVAKCLARDLIDAMHAQHAVSVGCSAASER